MSRTLESIPEPVFDSCCSVSRSEPLRNRLNNLCKCMQHLLTCEDFWVFELAAGFVQFWDTQKGAQRSLGQNRKFFLPSMSHLETRKWKILGFFFVQFTPEQISRTLQCLCWITSSDFFTFQPTWINQTVDLCKLQIIESIFDVIFQSQSHKRHKSTTFDSNQHPNHLWTRRNSMGNIFDSRVYFS